MTYFNHFYKWKFFILALLMIPLGLLSRKYGCDFVIKYVGDAIWAIMIFFAMRFLFINNQIKSFTYALLFCFAVEFSQLLDLSWLNSIRGNRFGALVLGRGFLWSDLVSYFAGISIVNWLEIFSLNTTNK